MSLLFWIPLIISAGIMIWEYFLLPRGERIRVPYRLVLVLGLISLTVSGYQYYKDNIEFLREKAEFRYGEVSEQQLEGDYQISIDLIPVGEKIVSYLAFEVQANPDARIWRVMLAEPTHSTNSSGDPNTNTWATSFQDVPPIPQKLIIKFEKRPNEYLIRGYPMPKGKNIIKWP